MNLIVFPLEGISQLLFWRCRDAMPTLWRMSNASLFFRRFYAASTSSFSSFCDLAFGDSTPLDANASYSFQADSLAGKAENLFEQLVGNGYAVAGLQHGSPCPAYAANNFWGAWPAKSEGFQTHDGYDSFHAAAEDFLRRAAAAGTPFALYFCDRASRLDDRCPEKEAAANASERFALGLSLVDAALNRLLAALDNLGLLADTLVAVVGLYGVDPWKHGVNMGRIYGTEPYADLAWTPLFLYFNQSNASIADQLMSMIDVKPTLLSILLPKLSRPPSGVITQGVNIQEYSRYYAFTQNLSALERGLHGPAEGLTKSYGVTDGNQRLLVSLDSPADGGGGMEMYYDPRDPGNTRNILDFFRMNDDGDLYESNFDGIRHSHFFSAVNQYNVGSIIESYNSMRRHLGTYVADKENAALRIAGSDKGKHRIPPYVFRRKRRRH